jgi:hypothetical protein
MDVMNSQTKPTIEHSGSCNTISWTPRSLCGR